MKKILPHMILLLTAVSVLFRGLYFNYETYAFLSILSLLCFLYYFIKLRNSETAHFNKLYIILGAALITANLLSFLKAVNPRENLGSVMMYTEFLIVFSVVFDYFYNKKEQLIKEIMFLTVIAGVICAAVGLEALTGSFKILDVTLFDRRLGTTFEYTNTASIYFALCTLFSLTLAGTARKPALKALLVGAGNLFVFSLFMTGSRGGYLVGTAAVLLFLLLQPSGFRVRSIVNLICTISPLLITINGFSRGISIHDYRMSTLWLVTSFISAAILYLVLYATGRIAYKFILNNKPIALPKGSNLIFTAVFIAFLICFIIFRADFAAMLPAVLSKRLVNLNLRDPNILFRLEFDKDAVKLIAGNWIFGLGGGGWQTSYQSVQDVFYTANYTHNNYLQVFVETGILGFLPYITFILVIFCNSIINYIKETDKRLKVYTSGMLCAFLALVVHSAFDFDLTYMSMALLLWTLFAAGSVKSSCMSFCSGKGIREMIFTDNFYFIGRKAVCFMIPAALCAFLFSAYAMFFVGAYNDRRGKECMIQGNYQSSRAYYEEAGRLDPQNTTYLFELNKLYNYFANASESERDRYNWLEKAAMAADKGISGNRYYPPQLITLIKTYQELDMPLKVLEYSKKLVLYQRCNSKNYELLARSYLNAVRYYERKNDMQEARKLLKACIEIQDSPYFKRSKASIFFNMTERKISTNPISNNFNLLISEAKEELGKISCEY